MDIPPLCIILLYILTHIMYINKYRGINTHRKALRNRCVLSVTPRSAYIILLYTQYLVSFPLHITIYVYLHRYSRFTRCFFKLHILFCSFIYRAYCIHYSDRNTPTVVAKSLIIVYTSI